MEVPSSSRLGPCLRGWGSSTTPPPSVSGGAIRRTTSRSPAAAIRGSSSRICQKRAAEPGQASRRLAGAVVDLDAVAVLGLGVGELQLGVDQVGLAQLAPSAEDDVSPGDLRADRPPRLTATR